MHGGDPIFLPPLNGLDNADLERQCWCSIAGAGSDDVRYAGFYLGLPDERSEAGAARFIPISVANVRCLQCGRGLPLTTDMKMRLLKKLTDLDEQDRPSCPEQAGFCRTCGSILLPARFPFVITGTGQIAFRQVSTITYTNCLDCGHAGLSDPPLRRPASAHERMTLIAAVHQRLWDLPNEARHP